MTKRIKNKIYDPGRFGMIRCPGCKGKGKIFDQDEKPTLCNVCGGFGWIKEAGNHVSDQDPN
jgi:ribosomal protein S27E